MFNSRDFSTYKKIPTNSPNYRIFKRFSESHIAKVPHNRICTNYHTNPRNEHESSPKPKSSRTRRPNAQNRHRRTSPPHTTKMHKPKARSRSTRAERALSSTCDFRMVKVQHYATIKALRRSREDLSIEWHTACARGEWRPPIDDPPAAAFFFLLFLFLLRLCLCWV